MTSTRSFDRKMRQYDRIRAHEVLEWARGRFRREHPGAPETLVYMEACQCGACLKLHVHLTCEEP
ncbi:MAG TPA: hypothetical protein VFI96_09190 [Longimicrobiaceae bacterium]|nr:hypothetical protein [Longimicrobiaceae bacterium]